VWGATSAPITTCSSAARFNPRSPCGERPVLFGWTIPVMYVSIHAPRVGSDLRQPWASMIAHGFNPRSPCGERPRHGWAFARRSAGFNPRSPCGERPRFVCPFPARTRRFNPRSPCGERPLSQM